MKKLKLNRVTSFLLILMFLFGLLPKINFSVKADAANTLPQADMMAVLVGDFAADQGLGQNWTPTNAKTIMKEYSKGIYELTVDFKVAKNYNYKVAFNGQWDNPKAIGNNGENKALNVTAPGKVTFKVDYQAGKVYDSINDLSEFKTAATLVGTLAQAGGNDWVPGDSSFDLDYIGEGTFSKKFSLKAGEYSYKVAYGHKWTNGEVQNNVEFKLDKDEAVTFVANPDTGICTDSINTPSIATSLSLIGTIRGGNGDWTADAKGYEFSCLTGDGKYIYSNYFSAGTFQYKGIENYSWDSGGIPKSGNKNIVIPDGGKYVVFICDRANGTMIDSINNPDEVSTTLGLKAPEVKVNSPIINPNGSITFNYKNDTAKAVYLAGTMNGWSSTSTAMTKDSNGTWTINLRLGDAAITGAYKFVVDGSWIIDPANMNALDKDGNSTFSMQTFAGRKVVLAGDIQAAVGESSWNPSSDKTKFIYSGNGFYTLTLKNVKAGDYQYKIAMGSWDPENYGANGKPYGDNIKISVPKAQDVTFYYNDDSHFVVNDLSYNVLDISLKGTGIPTGTKLQDKLLTGIYKASITLNKGIYNDIAAEVNGKTYSYGNIQVTDDSKVVTFSFDPKIEMVFTDISSNKVNGNAILFNSRDEQYKSPYGAVKLGDTIAFNLQAAKGDLTTAKLIIDAADGTQVIDMQKNGTFKYDTTGQYDRWTAQYKPSKISMDKYYFVVSNGSDVKEYGDSTGYYGIGKTGDIGTLGEYGFNVYDPNFKTPDWMKNAVVYQIFPDRFFNGDPLNDYLQKLARGTTPYEFYSNWYSLPESPDIEFLKDSKGNTVLDKDGNPVVDPNYIGVKGDGNWCNEMYGGDLKGIQAKLDYLKALGVNTLYINPISQSISNHRYDTTDYSHVDPLLGYDQDFAELTKEASKREMHIILDGVFNHVSDDSIYFDRYGKYMAKGKPLGAYQYWSRVYDTMNNQGITQQEAEKQVTAYFASIGITDLHYKDWFVINNKMVEAVNGDAAHYDYTGWDGYDSMPVIQHLNGTEYNIQSWDNEIIDGPNANSRQWLKNGASGWRLDVANEIADDVWPHFRKAVKEEGDNVIIGEIWDDASKYLLGDKFDSVMNYRFRGAVLDFVSGNGDAVKAMNELELIREEYPKEAFEAMLNLVDSHDTERILSYLDGKTTPYAPAASSDAKAKMRLVPLLQMTYPGAPCIYYGDEAGMVGVNNQDCRRAMIWGEGDKSQVEWYAQLANIRDKYPVLRTGDIVPLNVSADNSADIMAFARNDNTNHALVAINRNTNDITGLKLSTSSIPDGTVLINALNPSEKYTVSGGSIIVNVPEQSGVILVANYTAVTVNTNGLKDAYDPSFKIADRTVVKNDSTVISDIKNTSSGSSFVVSQTEEEVTKSVLNTAKAKNVVPVIVRGDTTFTLNDGKVIDTINNAGVTGLILSMSNYLANQQAVDKLATLNNANILKVLKLETNLPSGLFGGEVTVNTPLGTQYIGKKVFVYYLKSDGTYELVASPVVDKNGKITFGITHCSDYFVSDKELSASVVPSNTQPSGTTPVKPGSSIPKTGSIINYYDEIFAGLFVIFIGVLFVVSGKKEIKPKDC